ncbi:hypothetical protein AAL_04905 [Moelleriella libera RCEF 2490]|uniref:Uncharacterized protein n=1 Tax=Moelleriella libera RCEF 2490 TaxID=1081109 RepID=A0A168B4S3_9HYPO|nr:hypothetical protein AAL_04905 [Moelleriella libera RCEF 2490]
MEARDKAQREACHEPRQAPETCSHLTDHLTEAPGQPQGGEAAAVCGPSPKQDAEPNRSAEAGGEAPKTRQAMYWQKLKADPARWKAYKEVAAARQEKYWRKVRADSVKSERYKRAATARWHRLQEEKKADPVAYEAWREAQRASRQKYMDKLMADPERLAITRKKATIRARESWRRNKQKLRDAEAAGASPNQTGAVSGDQGSRSGHARPPIAGSRHPASLSNLLNPISGLPGSSPGGRDSTSKGSVSRPPNVENHPASLSNLLNPVSGPPGSCLNDKGPKPGSRVSRRPGAGRRRVAVSSLLNPDSDTPASLADGRDPTSQVRVPRPMDAGTHRADIASLLNPVDGPLGSFRRGKGPASGVGGPPSRLADARHGFWGQTPGDGDAKLSCVSLRPAAPRATCYVRALRPTS